MPKPVSSSFSNQPLDCHVDEPAPPSSSPPASAANACEPAASAPEPVVSQASTAATQSLVARFSPPASMPMPARSSPSLPVLSASTMTMSRVTSGGSSRIDASVLKVQVDAGAFKNTLEVGAAHAQFGNDFDVQATAVRRTSVLSAYGFSISATGDAGAARVNLGETNDDGSIGGNIGASAEALAGEITVDTPVGSLTYGQGVSIGVSGSMGVRDADHDGKPEFCAKFSIPAYTVGACVEQFW